MARTKQRGGKRPAQKQPAPAATMQGKGKGLAATLQGAGRTLAATLQGARRTLAAPQSAGKTSVAARQGAGKTHRISSKGRKTVAMPAGIKKKRRWMPGAKALAEIRKYQKGAELLLPRAPFVRLIREVLDNVRGERSDGTQWRLGLQAVEALQEASEAYVVNYLESAQLMAVRCKRVTLMQTHMEGVAEQRRMAGIHMR